MREVLIRWMGLQAWIVDRPAHGEVVEHLKAVSSESEGMRDAEAALAQAQQLRQELREAPPRPRLGAWPEGVLTGLESGE
jgi:hypothetical protein